MTSHEDIYRKIRTNHRKAKDRDQKIERHYSLLAQRVKVLYVQISTLVVLVAGDMITRYFMK